MTVVDRATKMVHLIPCWKTTTAGEAARLYWQQVVNFMEFLELSIRTGVLNL